MTLQEFISQVLSILAPVALALLTALAAWLTQVIHKRVSDQRLAQTLATVTKLVITAVANASQTVVADLKNPLKPGTWSEAAAASVKENVIQGVKETAPKLISELEKLGIETIDDQLGQLVEQEVMTRKAAELPAAVIASAAPLSMPLSMEMLGDVAKERP